MAEITLDDLKRKQEELLSRLDALQGETDGDKLVAVAAELQAAGEELETLAREFEQQEIERNGGPKQGNTEVVLTEAQRKRIHDETGVTMESLVMRDDAGIATRTMPMTDPRIIEYRALQEAKRRKIGEESDSALREKMDQVFAEIEAASPSAADKLAELKADPNFLGGVLQRK